MAHPDARLLAGIDWRRIVNSPLGPIVIRQVRQGGHPLLAFLDSIDNIDRLLVSTPGNGPGGRKPLLVIADGKFALPKIRAMASADGAVARRYNDVELLVPANATNHDLHFALLNATTILFGDGFSVKEAIDRARRGEAASSKNPLFARAGAVSAIQDVWAVIEDPAESLSSLGLQGSDLAEQVDTIELGLSMADTVKVQILIKALNSEAVETLATGVPALLKLAALTYTNQPYLAQVSKRLKVATEKNYLKMGVSLDGKLFEQAMNELRAAPSDAVQVAEAQPVAEPALARPQLPQPAAATRPAAATMLPAPTRRVVRIVGAEGGDIEIPYDARP